MIVMGHCSYCHVKMCEPKGAGQAPKPEDGFTHEESRRGVCNACNDQVDQHGKYQNWPKAEKKALKERQEQVLAGKQAELM